MVCLLLRCCDLFHVWNYLLCELNVVIAYEVNLVLHAIDDALKEEWKFEQIFCVLQDSIRHLVTLLPNVCVVEVALEEDHTKQIQ